MDDLITERHIYIVVRNLEGDLDEQQRSSLRRFAEWLIIIGRVPSEELVKLLGETVVAEECPICRSEVPMVDAIHGECANGHRMGRCMHSLLLCAESPPRTCPSCGLLSQRKNVWLLPEEDPFCIFCGTVLALSAA